MAQSALHAAIWANDEREVVRLLAIPATDIDEKDRRGFSPLCRAIQLGRSAVAERLLSCEAVDVLARDTRGRTALFWAAHYGTPEIAEKVLKRGASVTTASENGRTVLLQALQNRDALRMVRTLLQHGDWNERPNVRSYQKAQAFQKAVEQNYVNVVRAFLDDGEDVNRLLHRIYRAAFPWLVYTPATPLMLAAERGYKTMAQLLLARGADTQWNGYCRSAVSDAMENGHEAVARLLVENGAIIRLSDAVAANDANLARRLIEQGANVNETVGGTETPLLTWACLFNHEAVARLLIAFGANVIQTDRWGRTPLSGASGNDNLALAQFLIKHGADPVATDKAGTAYVALAAAVSGRKGDTVARWLIKTYGLGPDNGAEALSTVPRPDLLRFLIASGADVNAVTTTLKRTPLAWACLRRRADAVEILLAAGAIVGRHETRDGNTALSLAAGGGSARITRLLLETRTVAQWDLNYALQCAAIGGHVKTVRLLLEFGADSRTVRFSLRQTYYGGASERKNHEAVAAVFAEYGVTVGRRAEA